MPGDSAGRLCIGIAIATCLLAAGCSSPPAKPEPVPRYTADGAVSAESVDSGSATRYESAGGSIRWSGGIPIGGNPAPEYPASLLAARLPPVIVEVQIVVDGKGAVTRSTITSSSSDKPPFGESVLAALAQWRFEPLLRMSAEHSEALPFSQHYRFTFRQVNGRAVVDSVDSQAR